MPDLTTSIWVTASYSLAFGIYFSLFCLGLGAVVAGSLFQKTAAWYWQVPLAWLTGIYLHSAIAVLLSILGILHPGIMLIIHGLLWMLLGIRLRRFQLFAEQFDRICTVPSKITLLSFLPLLLFGGVLLLLSLLPPTSIDSLRYHLYYPRALLETTGLPMLFSPRELLTSFLAIQTLHTWPLGYGAEYAPALSSWCAYLLSCCFLYSWATPRVGALPALAGTLIAHTLLLKARSIPAADENAFSWLATLLFLAASFECLDSLRTYSDAGYQKKSPALKSTRVRPAKKTKDRKEKKATSDSPRGTKDLAPHNPHCESVQRWFLLLHLLAILAFCVKTPTLILTAPILIYFHAELARKKAIHTKLLLQLAAYSLLLMPFFLRSATLYQNSFFPLARAAFSSSEFDDHTLTTTLKVETHHPDAPHGLTGLLWETPKLYLLQQAQQVHPFYWLLALLGLIYCTKRGYYAPIIGVSSAYLLGFLLLPPYLPSYSAGLLDLLQVFGAAQLYSLLLATPMIRGQIHVQLLSTMLTISYQLIAYTSLGLLIFYTKPQLSALMRNQPKESYLSNTVELFASIRRTNAALPEDSKLLVTSSSRYYFAHPSEEFSPEMLLGQSAEIVYQPAELHRFLSNRGITHVLLNQDDGENRARQLALAAYLQYPLFATEVFSLEEQAITNHPLLPRITFSGHTSARLFALQPLSEENASETRREEHKLENDKELPVEDLTVIRRN